MTMKPTIPEVVDRFRAYRSNPDNFAWGSLHIVLADQNVADDDVAWCYRSAQERGDEEGASLAEILSRMSRTQRLKLSRVASQ